MNSLLESIVNCTSNVTINVDQSIEIECSIQYEYFQYDHLTDYQPSINLTFYRREKNSIYVPIHPLDLSTIKDVLVEKNQTSIWKRSISYTSPPIENGENYREYFCIVIPDSTQNEEIFSNTNRSCRAHINIQSKAFVCLGKTHSIIPLASDRDQNDSTVIITSLGNSILLLS